GALAYVGPFWASASRAMPVAVVGTAIGLINALGNLGGFVGPYVGGYLQDVSHGSFLSTSVVLAVALLLGGLVMLTLRGRANPASRADDPHRRPVGRCCATTGEPARLMDARPPASDAVAASEITTPARRFVW